MENGLQGDKNERKDPRKSCGRSPSTRLAPRGIDEGFKSEDDDQCRQHVLQGALTNGRAVVKRKSRI